MIKNKLFLSLLLLLGPSVWAGPLKIQFPKSLEHFEGNSKEKRNWIRSQNRKTLQTLTQSRNYREWFRFLKGRWSSSEIVQEANGSGFKLLLIDTGLGQPKRLVLKKGEEEQEIFNSFQFSMRNQVTVPAFSISPNERYALVHVFDQGSIDEHRVVVLDLQSRKQVEILTGVQSDSIPWMSDEVFAYDFYQNFETQSLVHRVGTPQNSDSLFMKNKKNVSIRACKEKNWVLLGRSEGDQYHSYVKKMNEDTEFQTTEYVDDVFFEDADFIWVSGPADEGRGFIGKVKKSSDLVWSVQKVIDEGPERMLTSVKRDGSHLISAWSWGKDRWIEIRHLDGSLEHSFKIPDGCGASAVGYSEDLEQLTLSMSSPIQQSKILHYDFKTQSFLEKEIFTAMTIKEGVRYVTEFVFYPSKDGTMIPMRLTYREDCKKKNSPLLMAAYGGFNVPGYMVPTYNVSDEEMLRQGVVLAYPGLRGGNEYGNSWHKAGRLDKKQNVFDDFIAGAEFLISEGWTSSAKLAAFGGSNGGLLMGAVLTQRPDLFGAVVPYAGVLDLPAALRTDNRFGRGWAYEYGDSRLGSVIDSLLSYSPVQNAVAQDYPGVLVLGGLNDTRVSPSHSQKFQHVLQQAQKGSSPILYYGVKNGGHWMLSPRYQDFITLRVEALRLGFLFDRWGLSFDESGTH